VDHVPFLRTTRFSVQAQEAGESGVSGVRRVSIVAERIGAGAIEEVLELHATTNPSRKVVSVGPPQGVNASVAILVAGFSVFVTASIIESG
jgi:hypothetical protein